MSLEQKAQWITLLPEPLYGLGNMTLLPGFSFPFPCSGFRRPEAILELILIQFIHHQNSGEEFRRVFQELIISDFSIPSLPTSQCCSYIYD